MNTLSLQAQKLISYFAESNNERNEDESGEEETTTDLKHHELFPYAKCFRGCYKFKSYKYNGDVCLGARRVLCLV